MKSESGGSGRAGWVSFLAPLVAAGTLLVLGALALLGHAAHDDLNVLVGGSLLVVGAFVTLAFSASQRKTAVEDSAALPTPEAPVCASCGRKLVDESAAT